MRIRENALGDLLRAFKRLQPADDAGRAAIAGLLGLAWGREDVPAASVSPPPRPSREGEPSPEAPALAPTPRPTITEMPSLPLQDAAAPTLAPLPEQGEHAASPPAWLVEADPLPLAADMPGPEPRPLEPLLDPIQTRALLTDALAATVADGPVDVRALEARICRVEPITDLPRLPRRSLGLGVEVLVDRAEALTPFFADQVALLERIRLLAGAENTQVLRFAGNPLAGAGPGGRRSWTPWKPPDPSRPILLLTDLGILDVADRDDEAPETGADWAAFARLAGKRGCPVLALVPYPRRRWPDEVIGLFPILPWDRRLLLKDLRQALGRRWVVTG